MSNLSKIKNLTKSLVKEFGETVEGQGYLMILAMLEKEEKSTPYTILDMHRAIKDKLAEHQVKDNYCSVEVKVFANIPRYEIYVVGKRVESDNPKDFYKKVMNTIETDAVEFNKKEALKNKDIVLS